MNTPEQQAEELAQKCAEAIYPMLLGREYERRRAIKIILQEIGLVELVRNQIVSQVCDNCGEQTLKNITLLALHGERDQLRAEVERLTDSISWSEAKTEDENINLRAENLRLKNHL